MYTVYLFLSLNHLPSPEYHKYIIYVTEYYEKLCQKLYLDHKELLFHISYVWRLTQLTIRAVAPLARALSAQLNIHPNRANQGTWHDVVANQRLGESSW